MSQWLLGNEKLCPGNDPTSHYEMRLSSDFHKGRIERELIKEHKILEIKCGIYSLSSKFHSNRSFLSETSNLEQKVSFYHLRVMLGNCSPSRFISKARDFFWRKLLCTPKYKIKGNNNITLSKKVWFSLFRFGFVSNPAPFKLSQSS